ncbi:MAG: polysaccharide deacetylase family protein [Candidatus Omnitrophota bacterium]
MKKLIKRLISNRYFAFSGKVKDKRIALTFDDGPHVDHTEDILKILKSENVKATFFVIGKEAERHPALVRHMAEDQHEVANHSYWHSRKGGVEEIKETEKSIEGIVGSSPRLFRPPWGRIGLKKLLYTATSNMKIVLWSFDSHDYKFNTAEELRRHLRRSRISAGDILLFHEDYAHTKEALPDILTDLKTRGFEFRTVSELLGKS